MAAPVPSLEMVVRRITAVTPIVFAALPIVAAWIGSLVTDFGRSARPEFFSVMAEGVLPVLLVAAVVEWGQLARSYLEMRPTDVVKFKMRSFSTGYGLLFAASEGLALYAVAAGERTTFLVLGVALGGAFLLFDLITNVRMRLGGDLESRLPENQVALYAKRVATGLEQRAKRHEFEANRLRSAADELDQPDEEAKRRAK
jgi:hypothetical protein